MLLGSFTHTGLLNAGSSYSQSQAVALPQDLVGSYNLFVEDRRRSGGLRGNQYGNNTSAANADQYCPAIAGPGSLRGQRPGHRYVRLRGVGEMDGEQSRERRHGDHILARQRLCRHGHDSRRQCGALGSFTNTAALAAGGSYSQSQLVALPIGFSGNYNLLVVTDEPAGTNTTHPVTESNYNDDTSAPIPITVNRQLPDLVVTSVTAPATAVTGGTASITWSVKNTGDAATNVNAWEDAIWASTHSTLASGGTDVLVTSVLHPNALAAGAGYTASDNVILPPSMAAGDYYFIVVTDSTDLVAGTNAANNQTATASTTSVALAPVPELAVSNVTLPATVNAGQLLPISWTVTNNGAATGDVPIVDSVYLSLGQTLDPAADRCLGSVTQNGGLAAGASYTQNADLQLPSGLAGSFYVFVVTDSNDAIFERDTADGTALASQAWTSSLRRWPTWWPAR